MVPSAPLCFDTGNDADQAICISKTKKANMKNRLVAIFCTGCSGGADSQDEVVGKAGAAVINQLKP
jgi:hypothetical protein